MRRPRVEILYFAGCPNYEAARALVDLISAELRIEPQIDLVEVSDLAATRALRFLGSPTVRVNGRDVERDAEKRDDFVLSCRVYRTEHGLRGQPAEAAVREAIARANE